MNHVALDDDASRRAVRERIDVSMLLEAGAGSGKTTLIVDRLIALVQSGVPVEGIAAVTFTRKAANELRERFETALELDARHNPSSLAALSERDRMFIGTIHSFCGRILREHAIEAGLPPDFEEVDDVQEAVLRERFWHTYITHAQLDGSPLVLALDEVGLSPADLLESFDAFHRHRDAIFDAPEVAAPAHQGVAAKLLALDAICQPLRARAAGARCGIFDTLGAMVRSHAASGGWARGADFSRAVRRLPRTWNAAFLPITLFGRKAVDKEPMKELEAAYTAFLEDELHPWEMSWAAHAYAPVVALLHDASERFANERRTIGRLTFDDLLLEAAQLLRNSPALRDAVSARWTHLLIDEFQDTDPVQAEIALLITSDPRSSGHWRTLAPLPGRLFLVGDPKQSIYRFRRADISTYEHVKDCLFASGEVHRLTSNFRSAHAIAELVNGHFSQVFPASAVRNGAEVIQAAFGPMIPSGDAAFRASGGRIARYLVGPAAHQHPGETCREDTRLLASWIAARVASKERRPEDFLVLTSQRGRLQQYAAELARHGIPVDVDGAHHDADALLAELIVVLRAVADPSNAVRVVAALEGISCGASHEELYAYRGPWDITFPPRDTGCAVAEGLSQLHAWWRSSQSLPTASLIEHVVDDLALIPLMAGSDLGESRAGLLLHLVARVREQHDDAGSLDGALTLIDELLRAENTAPPLRPNRSGALRLMNLHRAKGLEANVVVLAAPIRDTDRAPTVVTWRDDSGKARAAIRIADEECTLAAPASWPQLEAEDAERNDAERSRLLYVAVTRAREELVVAQRRSYEKSGEARTDESAWAPLTSSLAALEPLELVATWPDARQEVEHADLAAHLATINSRREQASLAGYRLLTVTDASKRLHANDGVDVARQRAITRDTGAQLGMEMGSALHAVLNGALRGRRDAVLDRFIEAVSWNSWAHEPTAVREDNHQRLRNLVAAAMTTEAWGLLSKGTVTPELPVAAWVTDTDADAVAPCLVEGVLDALSMTDASATVVDWKAAANEQRFESLRDAYDRQGATYASIVERRTGKPARHLVQPVRHE